MTHATGPGVRSLTAHAATATVLPAPGGPITTVNAPRAPFAMRSISRGRGIIQSGGAGIVTFDAGGNAPIAVGAVEGAAGRPVMSHLPQESN